MKPKTIYTGDNMGMKKKIRCPLCDSILVRKLPDMEDDLYECYYCPECKITFKRKIRNSR